MKDLIDFEQDRFDDVMPHELEIRVTAELKDVGAFAAVVIVEADDLVSVAEQAVAQVRAQEPGATSNQYSHVFPLQRRFSAAIESTVSMT